MSDRTNDHILNGPDGEIQRTLARIEESQKRSEDRIARIEAALVSRPESRAEPVPSRGGGSGFVIRNLPNYGKAKGQPIADASDHDLEWYANNCEKSVNDPSKAKWRDREEAMLAALRAEQRRRGSGGGDASGGRPFAGQQYGNDDDLQF
jgi:hypothetical protein